MAAATGKKKDQPKEIQYNDVPDYSGYCPNCPTCGTVMGFSYVAAKFKCPSCGFEMEEDDWDFECDTDDPNNPPYGCEACGGPWPDCKDSCKLFDD